MQNPFPRRARYLALAAIFALVFVWFSSPISNHGYPSWRNALPGDASSRALTVLSGGYRNVIREKVAVIIEDRPLTALVPVIMHFHTVLGTGWPIVLFTRPEANFTSAPFLRAVDESRILIKYLPDDIKLQISYDVSFLMTQPWIWEQLAPAKHVLIFQADSMICSNSPQRVDDFLKYDLIGAPISEHYGEGYNGGLSMRNRELTLEIIRNNDWMVDKNAYELRKKAWKAEMEASGTDVGDGSTIPGVLALDMEDQWYYLKMKELGARLPTEDEAKLFSVETVYYEWPLGYHQVQRYYGEEEDTLRHIDKWCPEHRLCTDDFIYLHPKGEEEKNEEEEKQEGEQEEGEQGEEEQGEEEQGEEEQGKEEQEQEEQVNIDEKKEEEQSEEFSEDHEQE